MISLLFVWTLQNGARYVLELRLVNDQGKQLVSTAIYTFIKNTYTFGNDEYKSGYVTSLQKRS